MSKDPFWTKREINRDYLKNSKNFPAIIQRSEKTFAAKPTKDQKDFPDIFYEGFYFKGKDKNEALKDDKVVIQKIKIHDYNKKRASEFFDIKNTPGPGSYTVKGAGSLVIKKPESQHGWKAFSVKSHGVTDRLQEQGNIGGNEPIVILKDDYIHKFGNFTEETSRKMKNTM